MMRKNGIGILWVVVVLLLANACQRAGNTEGVRSAEIQTEEDGGQVSAGDENRMAGVEPEECFWCGLGEERTSPYWGQKNVGLISLNTFEIVYVGIHCYDDFGQIVEKVTGVTRVHLEHGGEDGFSAFIFENTDRGFAEGTITLNGDAGLDLAKAAEHLCVECMGRLSAMDAEKEICGVGIVDFETGELRPFGQGAGSFGFGDYYVFCGIRDEGENGLGFLVFYCPIQEEAQQLKAE